MSLRGPVVAAIDLTDAADEVLAQAHTLAAGLHARFVVCHVLPEILHTRMLFPQLSETDAETHATIERRTREAIEARIALVTARSPDDFESVVEFGSAHSGILAQVEHVGAGLVVLGPGRVAERVARYAPCAVMVARPSKGGCVLAATDFSDPALPAIEIGAAEARRRGVKLRLMNCLELGEPVLWGSSSIAIGVLPALPGELIDEFERDALKRLRSSLAAMKIDGDCLVARGRPAAQIVETARDTPTALVVVGSRGRSRLSRALLGNVAETVLHTAPCSVLAVRLA
jgi:nucleotide-binding universal stress UspA family protein